MSKRFGLNLKRIRRQLKLTQAEVGFRVDRDASYIGKIERGVHSPPISFVYTIAKALGIHAEDLLK